MTLCAAAAQKIAHIYNKFYWLQVVVFSLIERRALSRNIRTLSVSFVPSMIIIFPWNLSKVRFHIQFHYHRGRESARLLATFNRTFLHLLISLLSCYLRSLRSRFPLFRAQITANERWYEFVYVFDNKYFCMNLTSLVSLPFHDSYVTFRKPCDNEMLLSWRVYEYFPPLISLHVYAYEMVSRRKYRNTFSAYSILLQNFNMT